VTALKNIVKERLGSTDHLVSREYKILVTRKMDDAAAVAAAAA
jgi:hypothetical protein